MMAFLRFEDLRVFKFQRNNKLEWERLPAAIDISRNLIDGSRLEAAPTKIKL